MKFVPEDQCSICAGCVERRRQHFSSDYFEISIKGVCEECLFEFWKAITVVCDSQEELEALRDAVRAERRRGVFRPSALVLQELRSKAPTKH
jgi:hypothetical protein